MLLIVAGVLLACEKFVAAGVVLAIYGCLHTAVVLGKMANQS